MSEETKNALIKAIKDDEMYDFISNNYWNMTDYELTTILKEYVYMLKELKEYCNKGLEFDESYVNLLEELIESIKERL